MTEFLGRARYQRHETAVESRPGARNGWQPPTAIKTTMGPVTVQRPKLRGTDERFCSRLFGLSVTRTNALESLVISGWVRGLSDRDIEAALAEVLGAEAALSRSTVSRICQQLKGEFTAWTSRSLAEVRLDYLYLDGSHFKLHPGAPAEPVVTPDDEHSGRGAQIRKARRQGLEWARRRRIAYHRKHGKEQRP